VPSSSVRPYVHMCVCNNFAALRRGIRAAPALLYFVWCPVIRYTQKRQSKNQQFVVNMIQFLKLICRNVQVSAELKLKVLDQVDYSGSIDYAFTEPWDKLHREP